MIILDTNILKGTSLRGPEAELLLAIRNTRAEQVGAPWIVLEELAAQQALLYEEKYETAKAAVEKLNAATPWATVTAPRKASPDRVRDHWRRRYSRLVDALPTSPSAYQEALFREANCLAPCKMVGGDNHKTGARDAAIWLTAVEYAREHPAEPVYFVSKDGDFGDGSSFAPPMDADIRDFGERFAFLPSLGDVLTKFATESQVDEDELIGLLEQPLNHRAVNRTAKFKHSFTGAAVSASGALEEIPCRKWDSPLTITFSGVDKIRAHEIAGHRWYTATVRWLVSGIGLDGRGYNVPNWVNCSWETRVLLSPTAPSKGLTIFRSEQMLPITVEDIPNLPGEQTAILHASEIRASQGLASWSVEDIEHAKRMMQREEGLQVLYPYTAALGRQVPMNKVLVNEMDRLHQETLFPDPDDE
ncbi:PIN domain-containing protein [Streptomyces sp. NPDC005148]